MSRPGRGSLVRSWVVRAGFVLKKARRESAGWSRKERTILFCMELSFAALGLSSSSHSLSGLNPEVVGGIRSQVLDPHGVVVVAVGFARAAPGLLCRLVQRISVRAIFDDAASGFVRRPGDFRRICGLLFDDWTIGDALGLGFILCPTDR